MVDRRYSRRSGKMLKNLSYETSVSKYFVFKKNCSDILDSPSVEKCLKWIPPRSPYSLIQEDLYSDPWQLLVGTVFLTKTNAERAIPQIHKFLYRFPSPEKLLSAETDEIIEFLSPLGLGNLRTQTLVRFSDEYLKKNWKYPVELYGIGKYGNDSYRIFCAGEWRETIPDDIPLTMYRNWLLDNCERLGL